MQTKSTKHVGSCHCRTVRFEVEIDASTGSECNCSICTKLAIKGGIVKPEAFTLLSDAGELGIYEWASKTSTRHFCKHCGVHCFGRGSLPQLGGAFVSVNLNCLDDVDPNAIQLSYWDGRHNNWEAGPRPTPWPID
jgi:hypothetical protein